MVLLSITITLVAEYKYVYYIRLILPSMYFIITMSGIVKWLQIYSEYNFATVAMPTLLV